MTPTNLVYWLAGYLELSDKNTGMTAEQVDTIRRHLALVLTNVTDDIEGHDVGYVPTEEELDAAMKYAFQTQKKEQVFSEDVKFIPSEADELRMKLFDLRASTRLCTCRRLDKDDPEAAYNGTLPIQTCLTY